MAKAKNRKKKLHKKKVKEKKELLEILNIKKFYSK
jgi:hypothetical protein